MFNEINDPDLNAICNLLYITFNDSNTNNIKQAQEKLIEYNDILMNKLNLILPIILDENSIKMSIQMRIALIIHIKNIIITKSIVQKFNFDYKSIISTINSQIFNNKGNINKKILDHILVVFEDFFSKDILNPEEKLNFFNNICDSNVNLAYFIGVSKVILKVGFDKYNIKPISQKLIPLLNIYLTQNHQDEIYISILDLIYEIIKKMHLFSLLKSCIDDLTQLYANNLMILLQNSNSILIKSKVYNIFSLLIKYEIIYYEKIKNEVLLEKIKILHNKILGDFSNMIKEENLKEITLYYNEKHYKDLIISELSILNSTINLGEKNIYFPLIFSVFIPIISAKPGYDEEKIDFFFMDFTNSLCESGSFSLMGICSEIVKNIAKNEGSAFVKIVVEECVRKIKEGINKLSQNSNMNPKFIFGSFFILFSHISYIIYNSDIREIFIKFFEETQKYLHLINDIYIKFELCYFYGVVLDRLGVSEVIFKSSISFLFNLILSPKSSETSTINSVSFEALEALKNISKIKEYNNYVFEQTNANIEGLLLGVLNIKFDGFFKLITIFIENMDMGTYMIKILTNLNERMNSDLKTLDKISSKCEDYQTLHNIIIEEFTLLNKIFILYKDKYSNEISNIFYDTFAYILNDNNDTFYNIIDYVLVCLAELCKKDKISNNAVNNINTNVSFINEINKTPNRCLLPLYLLPLLIHSNVPLSTNECSNTKTFSNTPSLSSTSSQPFTSSDNAFSPSNQYPISFSLFSILYFALESGGFWAEQTTQYLIETLKADDELSREEAYGLYRVFLVDKIMNESFREEVIDVIIGKLEDILCIYNEEPLDIFKTNDYYLGLFYLVILYTPCIKWSNEVFKYMNNKKFLDKFIDFTSMYSKMYFENPNSLPFFPSLIRQILLGLSNLILTISREDTQKTGKVVFIFWGFLTTQLKKEKEKIKSKMKQVFKESDDKELLDDLDDSEGDEEEEEHNTPPIDEDGIYISELLEKLEFSSGYKDEFKLFSNVFNYIISIKEAKNSLDIYFFPNINNKKLYSLLNIRRHKSVYRGIEFNLVRKIVRIKNKL